MPPPSIMTRSMRKTEIGLDSSEAEMFHRE